MSDTSAYGHDDLLPRCQVPLFSPREISTLLASFDVDIWLADLTLEAQALPDLEPLLAGEEQERAERFRLARDRERFVLRRGILRELLAQYTGCPASQIRFHTGRYGKPSLAPEHCSPIRFNLSHSEDMAILAISRTREVGIDLEALCTARARIEIAARFFSTCELADLSAVSSQRWPAAFYRCWTTKEAYVKARGEGLFLPLNQFAVSVDPERPPALVWSAEGAGEIARWCVRDVTPARNYTAVLVTEGAPTALRIYRWQRTIL